MIFFMTSSKISVLVMAFNRPDFVRRAMAPIRAYLPERLYLACDGPRINKGGEDLLVDETRRTMMGAIDWSCKVKTLFREKNFGCAQAVYEAISWFFEEEEYGIIIEDDVIVSLDFFKMCEELLPRYKDNTEIMQISAMNFNNEPNSNSYTFQKKPFVWGWATWRRAWTKMDMDMKAWPSFKMKSLVKYYGCFQTMMMWRSWRVTYSNLQYSTSWATRWHFSVISNNGVCICPLSNLAVNIGCESGTHYSDEDFAPYDYLRLGSLQFPFIHPRSVTLDPVQLRIDNKDFARIRLIGAKKKIRRWIKRLF